jgi:hypothetical protein
MERVAVIAPVVGGVKVTVMVQEAWPAREAPQVVAETANALALVPVMVFPERAMAELVLLVSVTVLAALVLVTP